MIIFYIYCIIIITCQLAEIVNYCAGRWGGHHYGDWRNYRGVNIAGFIPFGNIMAFAISLKILIMGPISIFLCWLDKR